MGGICNHRSYFFFTSLIAAVELAFMVSMDKEDFIAIGFGARHFENTWLSFYFVAYGLPFLAK
jgi:hypothetical protein